MDAESTLTFRRRGMAREELVAVSEALKPDNVDLPEGFEVAVEVEEDSLVVTVRGPSQLGTLKRIWDDVLVNFKAATETLESVEE